MRQNVRRWLYGAGALAAVGAMACSQGMASAATSGPRNAAGDSSATAVSTAAATYVPPRHDLYYGNKGAAVKSVERRLNQLHYYAGPVDGVFGQDLEWAVWAFKRVQGLPMNVMNSSLSARTAP